MFDGIMLGWRGKGIEQKVVMSEGCNLHMGFVGMVFCLLFCVMCRRVTGLLFALMIRRMMGRMRGMLRLVMCLGRIAFN
jgi:hypothetical protein